MSPHVNPIITYLGREQAMSLLKMGLIGQVASLISKLAEPSATQRSIDAITCRLSDQEALAFAAQYTEDVARLVQQYGGEIHYRLGTDHIRFTCAKCPFDKTIKEAPGLCQLIGAGLWSGTVQRFGYGKVIFKRRIAVGDDHCDILVYLKKAVEEDSEEDTVHLPALEPLPGTSSGDVSTNKIIRQLRAQLQHLERKTEELEDKLEERKLVERAKGMLMERLMLTEAQAMKRLQKESQDRNKKLVEIARIVLQASEII